ncbi:cytochrome P450 [Kitasatospora sp. NBC_00315]|uniref:cytochrome P450 family protein n=1 Tax=Kitasatospora sp. NBC_00315 TaxID=2975963 RepID=UPI0032476785
MPTPAADATVAVPPAREAAPAGLAAHMGRHPGEPNVMDPELLADPAAGYGRLREQAPIVRGRMPDDSPVWLVTRFDDVRELLRDARFVNSPMSVPGHTGPDPRTAPAEPTGLPVGLHRYLLGSLLDSDPPAHTRLRRLVSRAFSARRVEALRPRVERITAELIAALPGHATEGVVDLVEHFAYPLPITVICELVGIPEADRALWREWSADLLGTAAGRPAAATPVLIDHVRELVRRRRGAPADDLLSELLRPDGEAGDGDPLDDDEAVTMVLMLVLAGHETTAHLIGNGTAALLAHPDQLAALRADRGRWPGAVEELMRWCGPVQMTRLRYATEDLTFRDTRIRRGEAVRLVLVAANFDPRRHAGPERLDLLRESAGKGEQHVGFGHGIHYCLGAALARQEGEVALDALLGRYPALSLAVPADALEHVPLPDGRRLVRLPVRLGPPATS